MRNRVATLLLSQAFLLPVLVTAQTSLVLVLKSRIPLNVEGRIDRYSVDVKGQRLFASDASTNYLFVAGSTIVSGAL
jgi:hypothetical protein